VFQKLTYKITLQNVIKYALTYICARTTVLAHEDFGPPTMYSLTLTRIKHHSFPMAELSRLSAFFYLSFDSSCSLLVFRNISV